MLSTPCRALLGRAEGPTWQSTAWWVEKVGCWAWNALEVETET